jgi:membrane-associated phospholipid phosphatase
MRISGVILLVVLSGVDASAQPDSLTGTQPWHGIVMQDVGTFWHAFLYVGSAPSRWNGASVVTAGAAIGTTGLVSMADEQVALRAEMSKGHVADHMESVVRLYGEVWVVAAACGGSYAVGLLSGDRWLRETAFLAGTSLILTATATQLVKFTVGRARPFVAEGPGSFRMFSGEDAYHSFPSGHTAAAFSLSTVLAHRLNNGWATAGLYTLATLTSLSRVYADEHWFSDCVFSAMLSTAITSYMLDWFDKRGDPDASRGLRLVPGMGGVGLVYVF